jgi:hypothetical protein
VAVVTDAGRFASLCGFAAGVTPYAIRDTRACPRSIEAGPAYFFGHSPALARTPTAHILCHADRKASSMTDRDRKNIDPVEAKMSGHRKPPLTGRDIVAALGSSPLAEVQFDRFTVKSKVRDIEL